MPGLIVGTGESALLFSSAHAAERYLEATDVRNGEYGPAYDFEGHPYEILTDGFHQVIVNKIDHAPANASAAITILKNFLGARGVDAPAGARLLDLIKSAEPFVDDGM